MKFSVTLGVMISAAGIKEKQRNAKGTDNATKNALVTPIKTSESAIPQKPITISLQIIKAGSGSLIDACNLYQ